MPKVDILAIASGGGHWEQLMLLRNAFNGHSVHYVTTLQGLPAQSSIEKSAIIPDCNRNAPFRIAICTFRLIYLLVKLRPKYVVSTGALPGVLGLALGKALGARTIWIDSVANAEEFSMSGAIAKRFSDLWVSQWEHVAAKCGATYLGRVL